MSQPLLEAGIEVNRVQRHLNIDGRRKLRPHATHALARGTFTLGGFPLDDEDVAAPGGCQVVGNTRSDNPSTDDDYLSCLHSPSASHEVERSIVCDCDEDGILVLRLVVAYSTPGVIPKPRAFTCGARDLAWRPGQVFG